MKWFICLLGNQNQVARVAKNLTLETESLWASQTLVQFSRDMSHEKHVYTDLYYSWIISRTDMIASNRSSCATIVMAKYWLKENKH